MDTRWCQIVLYKLQITVIRKTNEHKRIVISE